MTHDQNFANRRALLNAFGQWAPEDGLTVHAFVGDMNDGGYVLVEADDGNVVPVMDMPDIVTIGEESLAWAQAGAEG